MEVCRVLHPVLPPTETWTGGIPGVSKAVLLLSKFRRQYPNEKPEQIWKKIYPEAIPGYASIDRERQKAEQLLLRERVRSRKHRQ